MIKKKLFNFLIYVLLALLLMNNAYAHDYNSKTNEKNVEKMINESYDRKEQYESLEGKHVSDEDAVIEEISSDSYWWPIGSSETQTNDGKTYASDEPETTEITSNYGYRSDPFGSGANLFHSGLDISGGSGLGSVNIIAAKDGTVVYSTKGGTVCPSGSQQSNCGGGYGNYIIIQHTDGNYTLYAHLYENSLTVSEGDSVRQGQVIAKMGSSGNSTGAHLHFEVREGQNDYSSTVNPLNYIDPDNPRPADISKEFLDWIDAFEGNEGVIGDQYVIGDCGDGVRTVGYGVTLEYNADAFARHGVDVSKYSFGDTLPIDLVDTIKLEVLNEHKSYVEKTLAKNNISLKTHQIYALTSFTYNCSNIEETYNFSTIYKKYGDTNELYDNFFDQCKHVNGEVWTGLVRRRKAEWYLFHTGKYIDGWELMK